MKLLLVVAILYVVFGQWNILVDAFFAHRQEKRDKEVA